MLRGYRLIQVFRDQREMRVIERDQKLGTARGDAKMVAGWARKRKVRKRTSVTNAVVLYWVEASVIQDGKPLLELTVRRVRSCRSRLNLIRHSEEAFRLSGDASLIETKLAGKRPR